MSGLIAIVGRPNVGKSALFNRIARQRIAIVHNQPGVTRDRISVETEWKGRELTLIDTGGIGLLRGERASDEITREAILQVNIAIESASVLVCVVSVQDGITPLDLEVAQRLRQSGKPVVVAGRCRIRRSWIRACFPDQRDSRPGHRRVVDSSRQSNARG